MPEQLQRLCRRVEGAQGSTVSWRRTRSENVTENLREHDARAKLGQRVAGTSSGVIVRCRALWRISVEDGTEGAMP
jgi:hypothetical protein